MEKYRYKYTNDTGYLIVPTYNYLAQFLENTYIEGNFCVLYMIMREFNFSEEQFFQYIIAKYHAIVYVEKEFPYFTVRFDHLKEAQDFCDELNSKSR